MMALDRANADGVGFRDFAMGEHLQAGEIVLAGSFTKPALAKVGDVFDVDYGPLGKLEFRFV